MTRIIVFSGIVVIGIVGALVGAVGLLAPVSVDPDIAVIGCGTAVSPDLSAAQARDDGSAANIPIDDGILVEPDYTQLCRMELEDRRLWASTLAGAGLGLAAAAAACGVLVGRRERAGTPSALGQQRPVGDA